MNTKVILNERHQLTDQQIALLNEKFGNEWEVYSVPAAGWTRDEIIQRSYELATSQTVFASPVPLLLREIAGGRGYFPLMFHNDRREKTEVNGRISFQLDEDGWQLI